jgi:RimJ/RimL family protein N-acetyltransferase
MPLNIWGQPVGDSLPDWQPRPTPQRRTLEGNWCRLIPLQQEQAPDLYHAFSQASDDSHWTWLPMEPPRDVDVFAQQLAQAAATDDPLHFTVIDNASQRPVGTLALMRIAPQHGVMEVGHVHFSALMQRSPLSTEAHWLLMQYAFNELGYRRYEWKCDSLNAPSRRAAQRLGFQFEGVFRQALVYKGRNRDTAWYSIIDSEWPRLNTAFQRWLSPANFDEQGRQRQTLEALRQRSPIGR